MSISMDAATRPARTGLVERLRTRRLNSVICYLILIPALLAGCGEQAPGETIVTEEMPGPAITEAAASDTPTGTSTPTAAHTASPTAAATETQTVTPAPTLTKNPTETPVPSDTAVPTETLTPTAEALQAAVIEARAFCRYGPGQAYLYSHEINAGDTVLVEGRNYSGSWLWVQPLDLDRHCWAAASVLEVSGDASTAPVVQTRLPQSTLYGPPEEVEADRDGDQVTIEWSPVWMTEDDYRGYLIEAVVCQNGARVPVAVHVDGTSTTLTDEQGCFGGSSGRLYTVEKHGYTNPVEIPWP